MSSFDWRRYWAEHDESETAARFALKMADTLDELLDWNELSSFADYGCGPATTMLALAQRHPETSFYGFDFSDTVLAKNRVKAGDAELGNVTFEQAALPDIDISRSFGAVTCFSSLHYVERIEEAIRSLFNVVEEGGWLLFNYPNIYTHWMYGRDVKKDDEEMKARFSLILDMRNIVTQRTIRSITGVKPRRFHSAIRGNIYIALRKPRRRT